MTPEQALQILDNAAARAQLTRQDHVAVQQAVAVLRRMIEQKLESDRKEAEGETP